MRKFLAVLGGIFAVIIVLVAAAIGYVSYVGKGLDKSSQEYVDALVPAIASHWSKDEVMRRASPELRELISNHPEDLDALFRKLSTLGALKTYEGSKGEAMVFVDARKGKSTTASYTAPATFEHGKATFQIKLILSSDKIWQLIYFHVDSPIFLQ